MSSTTFMNPVFNSLQQMDYNKSSILLQDGNEVDNSWELRIQINVVGEITVRVNGTFTIGTVMHCIAEQTESYQINWSDYALWWNQKNIWLLQTRRSLDQYNIQSDALLEFRPVHGKIRIVLPSLKTVDLNVNFSIRVFQVVVKLCKNLNIRYPEELSLSVPVKKSDLRQNVVMPIVGHGKMQKSIPQRSNGPSNQNTESRFNLNAPLTPLIGLNNNSSAFNTLRSNNLSLGDLSTINRQSERFLSNQMSSQSLDFDQIDMNQYSLCKFRMKPSMAFYEGWIHRPKNVVTKARMNYGWLDSSRSLMEHGIRPNCEGNMPILYLRFKYNMFYDLNPKYDTVRIHQIYEQARWDILSGNIECTEDEMIIFAACQLQAEYETTLGNYPDLNDIYTGTLPMSPYANSTRANNFDTFDTRYNTNNTRFFNQDSSSNSGTNYNVLKNYEDEIDYLLNEIEDSCRMNYSDNNDLSSESPMNSMANFHPQMRTNQAPMLKGKLRVCRDKINFLIKRYKTLFILLKDTSIFGFKRETDKIPIFSYTLKDCNVTYEVDCHADKYIINLSLLSDQLGDIYTASDLDNNNHTKNVKLQREHISIKCDNNEEFATWIAAFRLGSIGRTMASVEAYEKDKSNTLELLKLQLNNDNLEGFDSELVNMLNDLSFYCVDKIIAKAKSVESLKKRILKAHIGLRDLNVNSAKMKYIYTWQRLPTFGKNYFLVCFDKSKTIEPVRGTAHLFGTSEGGVLIAISHGRFEILSNSTGEVLRSWNFSEFKSWTVNWQSNSITLHFSNGKTEFRPLIGNCKTVIEFIGGYVFLNQRTPDKNQELNERFFHKLTGVTDLEQITLGEK